MVDCYIEIEIHVKCIYKHIEIFKLRNINLQAFHSFTLSLHLTVQTQTTEYIIELILLTVSIFDYHIDIVYFEILTDFLLLLGETWSFQLIY